MSVSPEGRVSGLHLRNHRKFFRSYDRTMSKELMQTVRKYCAVWVKADTAELKCCTVTKAHKDLL